MSVLKNKIGYDDALDAFGCHAVGGIVGGILTGIFCVPELSWTDFGGLIYTGDPTLLGAQCLGILVTIAFVGIGFACDRPYREGMLQGKPARFQGTRSSGYGYQRTQRICLPCIQRS